MYDLATNIPCEHFIILANTATYGGGGIYNSYTLTTAHHPSFRPVVVHEFGHSFGGLGDEYFYETADNNDETNICFEKTTPTIERIIPPITLIRIAVWTVCDNSSFLLEPKKFAAITVVPTDKPINKFTSKFIIAVVAPTAANDSSPANWPTTITSAALNKSCNILEQINGIENFNKTQKIEPFVISSW